MITLFQTAGSILAGAGSFRSVAGQIRSQLGSVRRALLVTSPSIRRNGWAEELRKQLASTGIVADILEDDIRPEPAAGDIESMHAKIGGETFDVYIGLGGGSVLDATKLLAALATNNRPLESMLGTDNIENDGIPTVLIPTTSGTGSEVTPNAIVTLPERQLKIGIVSRRLYPKLAVLDPELTLTLPKAVTAATGMDAFTHALESFIGRKANPISDMFALEAIRLISGSIIEAYENGSSIAARSAMLYGSAYGGMALAASGTAAVHALAYPLGGRFGIAHGVANAMLLPHVMEAQLDAVASRLSLAAEAMRQGTGSIGDCSNDAGTEAEWALEQLAEWTRRVGIPQNLAEYGITEPDLPSLAESASHVTRLMDNNPKSFTLGELERIYRKLLPVEGI
ncbi:iron-containing alcohol dehydrogenase [Paenibacillus sp. LHD-38]|uniref:iron-containing alcohol dehydrogenase n=1 Tax=Paenibacillus sp. LHD-38 TaxID=3072143 RepID=UPI00280E08C5|nr:iron-containing alcohol dehydrogenase [Paenibacillus sp. LHD-38]MDQ8737965.1 iron-containing alcohol dehydrogenase [Paenibacillus sp. LHD-38]